MEAIADHVIGLLNSLIAKELDLLCNFKDDLDKMKRKMHKIRAVLHDAEKKATRTEAIRIWLENLKDELLDADDLLDAYLADELAREVMTKDKMAQEVRIFFSKSNRIVCAYKMGCKIRAIFKNLDEIYKEKNQFMLDESSSSISNESHQWRLNADSFVSKQAVIGRDEERRRLVSTLLNPDVKSDVSVVPIVGIGGSGKTALAQLVCNDVSVKNHFEPIMRVCVSDETHPLDYSMLLAQKIIGGQQTFAQMEVSRKVEGKRFLLLLDDVWNIKSRWEWLKLQNLFIGGRKGSMIIVTTRSMEVADTMGKDLLFPLEGLGEDESWELFCRVAFLDGKEPDDNQGLVNIGKDIVRKCAGVPLAISTIGSLLSKKGLEVSEWSYIRDQELANIDLKDIGYDDNIILSILKLSYDHLPSHLKNCFAFCSLFPKDYEIERKVLIQMWIAEGFIIRPSDANKRLEVVGDEYFMQLLSRCLFQNVERDSFGEIKQCKMHDLIHDLAKEITKNESYIVTSGRIEEENIGNGIRHMSSHFDGAWKFPFGNVKTKRVRTILSSKGKCYFNPSHSCWSTTSLPKHLRALDLTKWLEIPKSIGYLKHLRYLDLSGNLKLKKLPRGITKVHNLLSLRLKWVYKFKTIA